MDNIPELRFPKFTSQWKNCNLGELLKIRSASRVHKNEWTESGVPFFRSSDVVARYKDLDNKKAYISLELFRKLSDKSGRVKKDDLLITGGGSIGIPYLVKTNEPLYFKDADLLWLKSSDQLNGYFLYTFFITMLFRKHLARINHTGTISHYTIEQAKSTPIKLPESKEQQKIAEFLSSVDNKIILLTEKKNLLQRYKKGVMQKLFSQELHVKNDQGNDFPEWEEKRLIKLLKEKISNGVMVEKSSFTSVNSSHFLIQLSDIYKSKKHIIPDTLTSINYTGNTREIKKGDTIINRVSIKPSGVATVRLVKNTPTGKPTLFESNMFRIRLKSEVISQDYFYYFSKNSSYLKQKLALAKVTNQASLSQTDIGFIKIKYPNLKEQEKISSFLSAIDKKIDFVIRQIEQTKTFKKGLLQKMFV